MRGVAIVLVVYTHLIQGMYGVINKDFFSDKIVTFACSFHMPLFAVISGYLFYKSFMRNNRSVLFSRMLKILHPLIVFSIIYWLFQELLYALNSKKLSLHYDTFQESFCGPFLWFLWALLYITFISAIAMSFAKYCTDNEWKQFTVFILISILFCFILDLLPNGQYALFLYPHFIVGIYLDRISSKIKWNSTLIYISISIMYLLLLCFWTNDKYIYISGASLIKSKYSWYYQLYIDSYRTITGMIGSFLVFLLVQKFKGLIGDIFTNIGSKTLEIYTIQCFLVSLFFPIIYSRFYYLYLNKFSCFSNIFFIDSILAPLFFCISMAGIGIIIKTTDHFRILRKILWRKE